MPTHPQPRDAPCVTHTPTPTQTPNFRQKPLPSLWPARGPRCARCALGSPEPSAVKVVQVADQTLQCCSAQKQGRFAERQVQHNAPWDAKALQANLRSLENTQIATQTGAGLSPPGHGTLPRMCKHTHIQTHRNLALLVANCSPPLPTLPTPTAPCIAAPDLQGQHPGTSPASSAMWVTMQQDGRCPQAPTTALPRSTQQAAPSREGGRHALAAPLLACWWVRWCETQGLDRGAAPRGCRCDRTACWAVGAPHPPNITAPPGKRRMTQQPVCDPVRQTHSRPGHALWSLWGCFGTVLSHASKQDRAQWHSQPACQGVVQRRSRSFTCLLATTAQKQQQKQQQQ